jgi:hypothetical protein
MPRYIAMLVTLSSALTVSADERSANEFRKVKSFSVPEAHQAVAVDAKSLYAISNRTIARYDKETTESKPKALARWTAPTDSPVRHLNSGIVLNGRLYCANSNWPMKPLRNTVEMFEAETLQHLERKEFPETETRTSGRRDWSVTTTTGRALASGLFQNPSSNGFCQTATPAERSVRKGVYS